jgi:F-type H+-transporting ATPase subunit gamma
MSSMRDIKQRIENVRSVEQIIKAMDMVASTKLVKIRSQLEGVRPIYHELKRVVEE